MSIIIDPEAWYSVLEAAVIQGKQPATLAKERCLGSGCAYTRNGRQILYRGRDLINHLEARRVHHGTEYRERFKALGKS